MSACEIFPISREKKIGRGGLIRKARAGMKGSAFYEGLNMGGRRQETEENSLP